MTRWPGALGFLCLAGAWVVFADHPAGDVLLAVH